MCLTTMHFKIQNTSTVAGVGGRILLFFLNRGETKAETLKTHFRINSMTRGQPRFANEAVES